MAKDRFSTVDVIETTIGELIETITQIALEAGKSEQEGYELASIAVENLLRKNRQHPDLAIN